MNATKSMPDFAALQTSQTRTMMNLTDTAFGFITRMNALGMEAACSMMKVAAGNVAGSCGEAMQNMVPAPSTDGQAPSMERTMTYIRSVGDRSAQSQAEMAELAESYVDEMTNLVTTTLDEVAEAAPMASTAATVAAMKSAVSGVSAAGKGMINNARKVTPLLMLSALAGEETAKAAAAAKSEKQVRKAA